MEYKNNKTHLKIDGNCGCYFKYDNPLSFYWQRLMYDIFLYNKPKNNTVKIYQSNRFYLDEFKQDSDRFTFNRLLDSINYLYTFDYDKEKSTLKYWQNILEGK